MTAAEKERYEYYLLGDYMPIRGTVPEGYNFIAKAEAPSQTTGQLEESDHFRARIYNSDEIEEITKEEFDEHCKRMFLEFTQKKTDPDVPNPGV